MEKGLVTQKDFFTTIEKLSMNKGVDVDKIKQLMEMNEHVLDRNAKQAFNASMTKAQNEIELVVAGTENTQTESKYANLKEILLATKPIYTAAGFSLMFYEGETSKEKHKRVCVDIMHQDGHTEKRWVDVAIQTTGIKGSAMMTEIHGEGSAFSYGRRYLTCMIFNVPTGDDDDGNAAGGKVAPLIDEKQISAIGRLKATSGISEKRYTASILQLYGVDKTEKLTVDQGKDCIKTLNHAIADKKKEQK